MVFIHVESNRGERQASYSYGNDHVFNKSEVYSADAQVLLEEIDWTEIGEQGSCASNNHDFVGSAHRGSYVVDLNAN